MTPSYSIRLFLILGLFTRSAVAETKIFPFARGIIDANGKPQPWTLAKVRQHRDDAIGKLDKKISVQEKDGSQFRIYPRERNQGR